MPAEQSTPSVPQISHQLRNQRPGSPRRPSKLAKIDGGDFSDDVEEEEIESVDRNMSPNPRIQRYLVAIEYIGTRFSGAQKQATGRTVVGVLELPPHEPSVVKRAVNHFLQKNEGDMMVIDVQCVPSDFHARYKAQERTYFYRLLSGKEPLSTFDKDRAWHVPEELDLLAMQVLVGRHDFSSFRAAACQAKSPIRTLEELTVTEVSSSPYFPSLLEREQSNYATLENSGGEVIQGFGIRKRHRCFVVTARAHSFLYHQVRLLVGVLKSVGTGDLTVSDGTTM
ncbi:hypothetical protein DH2020_036149 [Rehmannia glutinosa]|uniref:tRNA pseudouridine synthase n=1 Tax=Rehmannia glutinosa TaxID=99300 RepID=A0ABR0V773_REHGL